jgi:hypothetical protein
LTFALEWKRDLGVVPTLTRPFPQNGVIQSTSLIQFSLLLEVFMPLAPRCAFCLELRVLRKTKPGRVSRCPLCKNELFITLSGRTYRYDRTIPLRSSGRVRRLLLAGVAVVLFIAGTLGLGLLPYLMRDPAEASYSLPPEPVLLSEAPYPDNGQPVVPPPAPLPEAPQTTRPRPFPPSIQPHATLPDASPLPVLPEKPAPL